MSVLNLLQLYIIMVLLILLGAEWAVQNAPESMPNPAPPSQLEAR